MANYAFVENDSIVGVYDSLPNNWKNFSNFFALEGQTEYLKSLGWYKIEHVIPSYDSEYQKLDNPYRWLENDTVYESQQVINIRPQFIEPPSAAELEAQRIQHLQDQWASIRKTRDQLMAEFEWRYDRYERQIRLNLPTTDNIINMDNYMQALADITLQVDAYNIVWPTYNVAE